MSIIDTALTGTQAAQTALNATSQNIANVMTPGYTRQAALLTTVVARQQGALTAGDGVEVPSLLRFSDSYKSLQMWQANSELASRATPQPYLTQLEQVMGDEASSINSGLDAFFGALNAASVEPSSNPLRQQVIAAAGAVAQRFNNLGQVLSNQRDSIAKQRESVVAQVALPLGLAVLRGAGLLADAVMALSVVRRLCPHRCAGTGVFLCAWHEDEQAGAQGRAQEQRGPS